MTVSLPHHTADVVTVAIPADGWDQIGAARRQLSQMAHIAAACGDRRAAELGDTLIDLVDSIRAQVADATGEHRWSSDTCGACPDCQGVPGGESWCAEPDRFVDVHPTAA